MVDHTVNDIHELINIIGSTAGRGTLCPLLPKRLVSGEWIVVAIMHFFPRLQENLWMEALTDLATCNYQPYRCAM